MNRAQRSPHLNVLPANPPLRDLNVPIGILVPKEGVNRLPGGAEVVRVQLFRHVAHERVAARDDPSAPPRVITIHQMYSQPHMRGHHDSSAREAGREGAEDR